MTYRVLRFSLVTSILVVVGFAPAVRAEVYGLKSCGSDIGCDAVKGDPSRSPTTLFSLSDDGLIFTEIGVVTVSGIPIDADALAVSTDQRLFCFELLNSSTGPPSGSRLIEIDPATAVATPIGPELLGREMRGAVFDRSGVLKVYDSVTSELLEIDVDNGLQVLGAARPLTLDGLPYSGTHISDLAVRADGQMFYIEIREMYALDADDGALTLLWSDPVPALDGLENLYMGAAFAPAAGFDLFAFDGRATEDIFVYETAVDNTRQELHTAVIPAYNAGSGDLGAALPGCEGGLGEVWGVQVGTASAGAELVLSWDDDPTFSEYAVFDDVSTDGQFANPVGLAVSGLTGLQLSMPGGNAFFLVAGVSGPCIGPR